MVGGGERGRVSFFFEELSVSKINSAFVPTLFILRYAQLLLYTINVL